MIIYGGAFNGSLADNESVMTRLKHKNISLNKKLTWNQAAIAFRFEEISQDHFSNSQWKFDFEYNSNNDKDYVSSRSCP